MTPDVGSLRAASEKATPGPWSAGDEPGTENGVWTEVYTSEPDEDGVASQLVAWCHSDWRDEADAEFIAAAVNYVRAALAGPVTSEPHEDTPTADLAAQLLGSEWHEHPLTTPSGKRLIWKHRHERLPPPEPAPSEREASAESPESATRGNQIERIAAVLSELLRDNEWYDRIGTMHGGPYDLSRIDAATTAYDAGLRAADRDFAESGRSPEAQIDVDRLVKAMDAADDEMLQRRYTLASFANETYAPVVAHEYAARLAAATPESRTE